MSHLTKEKIVAAIRAELRRQFEEEHIGWYSDEGKPYVAVDGSVDLEKIAEAIITTIFMSTGSIKACKLGVGCNETGVCYAEAHGKPDECGAL